MSDIQHYEALEHIRQCEFIARLLGVTADNVLNAFVQMNRATFDQFCDAVGESDPGERARLLEWMRDRKGDDDE